MGGYLPRTIRMICCDFPSVIYVGVAKVVQHKRPNKKKKPARRKVNFAKSKVREQPKPVPKKDIKMM